MVLTILLVGCTTENPTSNVINDNTNQPSNPTQPSLDNPAGIEPVMKEFTVHGGKFRFNPSEMRVKVGDTVRINFISDDMMHDLVIDELGVRTKVIPSGSSDVIEFTVDKEGTYEYYCSVGNHRAQGMVGNLIVEP